MTAWLPETVPVDVEPYQVDDDTVNVYGDHDDTWGPRETRMAYGWASVASTEPALLQRDQVDVDVQVFASWTVDPRDRMWIDGRRFEVVGRPLDYNNGPFGFRPGYVINLRNQEG